VPIEDVKMGKAIAAGAEGQVSMAMVRGVQCVAKTLKKNPIPSAHDDLIRELDLLTGMHDHPNVVKFVGACIKDPDNPILLEEWVGGPSLEKFLIDRRPAKLEKRTIWSWTNDLLQGLNFLHNRNPIIIHRDLKPANLLLSTDLCTLKLTDFGLSKAVDRSQRDTATHTGFTGTKRYMAPEVRSQMVGHYDEKVDIFSSALICWYIATMQAPAILPDDALQARPNLALVQWPSFEALLTQMWAHESRARPSALSCIQILQSMPDKPDMSKGPAPASAGCCSVQ
jgi:serine/threonine protein kinase